MNKSRLPFAALAALTMAVSTSCSDLPLPAPASSGSPETTAVQAASEQLAAVYARLAQNGARVFTLDPASSSVRIYVFRDGRAARLGHNHVLSAPRFAGFLSLPSTGTADTRFDLEFRLDELEIDNPAYRTGLGAAFASVLSPEAIEGTREHMLGESNMQAARFPTVRIHCLHISGEAPHYAAQVAVQMHGTSREMWIPLTVTGLPERLAVSGSFVLRQTDFGIHPYSVAGGLLAVKDEVVVDFSLTGR
jgi:polyisoprenoid-binding protein YceI